MTYAKELACNLFNTYQDWYDNYLDVVGHEPDENLKFGAMTYYSIGDEEEEK